MKAVIRRHPATRAWAALAMMSTMIMAAYGATPGTAAQQAATTANGVPKLTMVMAQAELKDSINAKRAKLGQLIRARLMEPVKLNNGDELPKNTILEGHVVQVQRSEHRSDSKVVVTFDKAQLKGGEQLTVKATLLTMWEPNQGVSSGSSPNSAFSRGQMTGVSISGTPGTANIPPSMDVPQPNMKHGRQAVPGVTLHSNIHEKTSATFTEKRRNVDVPGGTRMQFALVVIPKGVHIVN